MSIIKSASLGAVSALAAAVFAGPVFADGMPSRGRVAAPAPKAGCDVVGNVGLTTDYVFRGISQSNENAAVQGGVDLTCGRFYVGVWASSIWAIEGTTEVDLYAGFKHTTGPITWDVGLIYYTYPGEKTLFENTLELKLGASGDIWKGGTLGGTAFYAPDPQIWTLEASFAQVLPKVGMFSPTFSATYGAVRPDDGNDYNYWNIGLTVGFLEKWSLDVRYWDTDIEGCTSGVFSCDERVVGTVKYTF
jgi:uncharacterized protein (TIGR02001 family)